MAASRVAGSARRSGSTGSGMCRSRRGSKRGRAATQSLLDVSEQTRHDCDLLGERIRISRTMKHRHDFADRRTLVRTVAVLFLSALVHIGCGGGEDAPSVPDAAVLSDADAPDAAPVDKAAPCASQFGDALTAAFGRL